MIYKPHLVLTTMIFASVALGGLVAGNAEAGDDPCTTKNFSSAKVEAACERGGRDAAKDYMKSVVKTAKQAGEDVGCKDCHESFKTYETKAGAEERLAKLEKL